MSESTEKNFSSIETDDVLFQAFDAAVLTHLLDDTIGAHRKITDSAQQEARRRGVIAVRNAILDALIAEAKKDSLHVANATGQIVGLLAHWLRTKREEES